jgi:hypothetical protein
MKLPLSIQQYSPLFAVLVWAEVKVGDYGAFECVVCGLQGHGIGDWDC